MVYFYKVIQRRNTFCIVYLHYTVCVIRFVFYFDIIQYIEYCSYIIHLVLYWYGFISVGCLRLLVYTLPALPSESMKYLLYILSYLFQNCCWLLQWIVVQCSKQNKGRWLLWKIQKQIPAKIMENLRNSNYIFVFLYFLQRIKSRCRIWQRRGKSFDRDAARMPRFMAAPVPGFSGFPQDSYGAGPAPGWP